MRFVIANKLVELRLEAGGWVAGVIEGGDFIAVDRPLPTLLEALGSAAEVLGDEE